MDPNATLINLRTAITRFWAAVDSGTPDEVHNAGVHVAELAQGMDEWLSAGEFLPADWQKGRA